ncbi:MAG: hypothetical protein FIB06_10485 [Betaproteobacteria bacterium]|nr:hypothetical protein [Betaproteobacteria bacterium]
MLDPEIVAFIQTGVSISLAARGPDRLPSMSRGLGCKLSPDGRLLHVFLRRSQSSALIDNIGDNGQVANVFSLPSSNRTVQLKGNDARVVRFDPADGPIVDRHIADFLREVVPLGTPEAVVRTILAYEPDDLVTVVYSPAAAFSQTPGPKAGKPLD